MAKSVGGGVPARVNGTHKMCQTMDMMVMSSLNFAFIVIAINKDIFIHLFLIHSFRQVMIGVKCCFQSCFKYAGSVKI